MPHFLRLPCESTFTVYLEANEVQKLLFVITTTGNSIQRYWIIEFMFIPCDNVLKGKL